MKGVGKFGGNLQDFRQSLVGEGGVKSCVDVVKWHAVGKALQDQGDGQSGTPDRQLPAKQLRVCDNPLVILLCGWLPGRHINRRAQSEA
jgi:hypothetical protein